MKRLVVLLAMLLLATPTVIVSLWVAPARADVPGGTYQIEGFVFDQNNQPIRQCTVHLAISVYVKNTDGTLQRYSYTGYALQTDGDGWYSVTAPIPTYTGRLPFAGAAALVIYASPPPPWLVTDETGGYGATTSPPADNVTFWCSAVTIDEHQ